MVNINVLKDYLSMYANPKDIEQMIRNTLSAAAGIIFLISMIQCFLGYKLTKLWVTISGFFLFGIIGAAAALSIGPFDGKSVIIILLSAFSGAAIAFSLYKIGIFVLGACSGFMMGVLIFNNYDFGIILGIIIGILVLIFMKPIIIISTAVPSGIIAGISLVQIMGSGNEKSGLFIGGALAICGIVVQFITNKKSNWSRNRNKNKSRHENNTEKLEIDRLNNALGIILGKLKKKTDRRHHNESNYNIRSDNNFNNPNSDTIIMLRCSKFGEICPDGSKFCNRCGEPLESSINLNNRRKY